MVATEIMRSRDQKEEEDVILETITDEEQDDPVKILPNPLSKQDKHEPIVGIINVTSSSENEEKANIGPKKKKLKLARGHRDKKLEFSRSRTGRCKFCHQRLISAPKRPLEDEKKKRKENEVLKDPSFLIDGSSPDEKEYYFLENFSLFDQADHLILLESGLLESGVSIFFSGSIVSPYDSNTSVFLEKSSAIAGWWTCGFNEGEEISIGVSTEYGEYILKQPHSKYQPFMKELTDRSLLTKLVVSIIGGSFSEANALDFEGLVEKLGQETERLGLPPFSEEDLFRHGKFVLEQIRTYEDAGDEDEIGILEAPCLQHIMTYSGFDDKDEVEVQKHKPQRTRPEKVAQTHSKAATTPVVANVFRTFFPKHMQKSDTKEEVLVESRRCGVCQNCQKRAFCGICGSCRSMTQFGGTFAGTKSCVKRPECLRIKSSDEIVVLDEISSSNSNADKKPENLICFPNAPVVNAAKDLHLYDRVVINEEEYRIGDFVMIKADFEGTALFVGQILSIAKEGRNESGSYSHVRWFCRGSDTILGETAKERELFALDECEDVELSQIVYKTKVTYIPTPKDWSMHGGTISGLEELTKMEQEKGYWFKFKYDSKYSRFTSIQYSAEFEKNLAHTLLGECKLCEKLEDYAKSRIPQLIDEETFRLLGEVFRTGDAVFVSPSAFPMPNNRPESLNYRYIGTNHYDEKKYPEKYRHESTKIKGSNANTTDPFRICVIERLIVTNEEKFAVKIRKMYRPENTSLTPKESDDLDFSYVFWSEDHIAINPWFIEGKCVLRPKQILHSDDWYTQGRFRFIFDKKYCSKYQKFEPLPTEVIKRFKNTDQYPESEGVYPPISRPLRTLDVFSGCGGLSLGLHKAGVAETLWAIDNNESAVEAFKGNYPNAEVFREDCNKVLQKVMDGCYNIEGKSFPRRGDVEFLVGGPPCQGFSNLNLFTDREYSLFKNSLVVSHLSFCDFYRPKFFILENVKGFHFNFKNMMSKLTLRALLNIGYQCTMGILQAGHYGTPQNRKRVIILAAAPDQILPNHPDPENVFGIPICPFVVDKRAFFLNCKWKDSAPYRTVTVRDSIGDLPLIPSGSMKEKLPYIGPPQSPYQRMMREGSSKITDHLSKSLTVLNQKRIDLIPKEPGADWRDLPNIEVLLSNGEMTEILRYPYRTASQPKKSPNRGVCHCLQFKKPRKKDCDPSSCQQKCTIIPFSLSHTAWKHNHWSGLFGRVAWDGFFSTLITDPSPMSKQGRVLHPEQNRILSVRECARSQGFPDTFKFHGPISERFRQIGNAVPPLMGAAIGREIRKCVSKKEMFPDCV